MASSFRNTIFSVLFGHSFVMCTGRRENMSELSSLLGAFGVRGEVVLSGGKVRRLLRGGVS